MKKEYPTWVCNVCGMKYGRDFNLASTYHVGTCDNCGREFEMVTEPRDFGYPDFTEEPR